MKHIRTYHFLVGAICCLALSACDKYLDIVPDDGVATIEMAFNMRSQAIKYLSSCYQPMAEVTAGYLDYVGFTGGDEVFVKRSQIGNKYWNATAAPIALGYQNVSSVYGNDFQKMYQAIRYCLTLVDEIDSVPDMEQWEKEQWKAEAKVLHALYLFHLVRKWGPVPIVRENLEVSTSVELSRVSRNNIDECFDYMIELLDEAIPSLFDKPFSPEEYGRITKPIAATLKAKIAVTAASPLFNGNEEQSSLVNKDGTRLFPSKDEDQKKARWIAALAACEEAITACQEASISELYTYEGSFRGDEHLVRELSLRECICEDFNKEVIWANTQNAGSNTNLQRFTSVNTAADKYPDLFYFMPSSVSVPLKIVNQFYTSRGLPVENDLLRKDVDPEQLRTATSGEEEKWYFQEGYITAEFNFDREPRFYAWLAFDGSLWLNKLDNDPTPSQLSKVQKLLNCNEVTGYSVKKLSKHSQVVSSASVATTTKYIFPCLRLADLYLLYAEAVNEVEGPEGAHSEDMFARLDEIRERAGIPDVKRSWDEFSDSPGKYRTQSGMREIIHRERANELAFEGERFWDIRRWKTAPSEYAKNAYGWDVANASQRAKYYKATLVYETRFILRDYFWPFSTAILENNPNLVQNTGW